MMLDRDEDLPDQAITPSKEYDDNLDIFEGPVEMAPLSEKDRVGMVCDSAPIVLRPLSQAEEPAAPSVPLDLKPCKGMDEPAINSGMKPVSKLFTDDWLRTNNAKLRRPWDGVDLS